MVDQLSECRTHRGPSADYKDIGAKEGVRAGLQASLLPFSQAV